MFTQFIKSKGNLSVLTQSQDGWMPRAQCIIEQLLGRKLKPWEDVIHLDGNPLNDNLKNLEIVADIKEMRLHQDEELEDYLDDLDALLGNAWL